MSSIDEFPSLVCYHEPEVAGSWEVVGERVITLGTNM